MTPRLRSMPGTSWLGAAFVYTKAAPSQLVPGIDLSRGVIELEEALEAAAGQAHRRQGAGGQGEVAVGLACARGGARHPAADIFDLGRVDVDGHDFAAGRGECE